MKLGVALPLIDLDVGGSPAAIQEFAQTAEEIGYQDVSAPDHVLGVNVASRPDWGNRNTPVVCFMTRSYCLASRRSDEKGRILNRNSGPGVASGRFGGDASHVA